MGGRGFRGPVFPNRPGRGTAGPWVTKRFFGLTGGLASVFRGKEAGGGLLPVGVG